VRRKRRSLGLAKPYSCSTNGGEAITDSNYDVDNTHWKENTMTMQRTLAFFLLLGLVLMAGVAQAVTLFSRRFFRMGRAKSIVTSSTSAVRCVT